LGQWPDLRLTTHAPADADTAAASGPARVIPARSNAEHRHPRGTDGHRRGAGQATLQWPADPGGSDLNATRREVATISRPLPGSSPGWKRVRGRRRVELGRAARAVRGPASQPGFGDHRCGQRRADRRRQGSGCPVAECCPGH